MRSEHKEREKYLQLRHPMDYNWEDVIRRLSRYVASMRNSRPVDAIFGTRIHSAAVSASTLRARGTGSMRELRIVERGAVRGTSISREAEVVVGIRRRPRWCQE